MRHGPEDLLDNQGKPSSFSALRSTRVAASKGPVHFKRNKYCQAGLWCYLHLCVAVSRAQHLAEGFGGFVEGLRLRQRLLPAWLRLQAAPPHHHGCQHLQAPGTA